MSVLCAATHSPDQPPLPLRTPRRACPRRIGERARVCARARSESTFQGGPTVEVLSASGSNPTSNWKLSGPVQRVYDKTVRGYIVKCDGRQNVRMQLPKDDRRSLGLVQPFLVLQINVRAPSRRMLPPRPHERFTPRAHLTPPPPLPPRAAARGEALHP